MRTLSISSCAFVALTSLIQGCGAGAMVEPGHRGILFDPRAQAVHADILTPGYHKIPSCTFSSVCARVDDFDVTFSTRKEVISSNSAEGLPVELHLAVIYRPIEKELYELDTEIGPNYYDEVVGPEFRSAARGVLARHSYGELQKTNEKIEDEMEVDLRRRITGKHVEVASITMEEVIYAPEIAHAVQAKLVAEQEAVRQKAALEADARKKKVEMEQAAEQAKLRGEQTMRDKEIERKVAEEQAAIDKVKAESDAQLRIMKAESEAKTRTLLARAEAEEKKSEFSHITPLVVQMHAYDALAQLGGSGTTIYLGDYSRAPQFLFPGGYSVPYAPSAPIGPRKEESSKKASYEPK
jgi:regulator of protease activity HflC (stomatin/prohibitin superfamily)